MVQVENGTVLDDQGLIVAFGYDKFVSDICLGDGCLICGASPTEKEFNDEHVLPKWLLKHAGLFDQFITLPNTTKIKYGQYTLPCCADCNSFYGKNLEEKVRPLIIGGYSNFKNVITEETAEVVYIWLAFVFFKTHLKDTLLRLYQLGMASSYSRCNSKCLYRRKVRDGLYRNFCCFACILWQPSHPI